MFNYMLNISYCTWNWKIISISIQLQISSSSERCTLLKKKKKYPTWKFFRVHTVGKEWATGQCRCPVTARIPAALLHSSSHCQHLNPWRPMLLKVGDTLTQPQWAAASTHPSTGFPNTWFFRYHRASMRRPTHPWWRSNTHLWPTSAQYS